MKTSIFLPLRVIFLFSCMTLFLTACGKRGDPMPPSDCNDNAFPATSAEVPRTSCPPQTFPGVYPPEE